MEGIIIFEKNIEKKDYELRVYNPQNILLVAFFLEEVDDRAEHFIEWFIDQKKEDWGNDLVDCVVDEDVVEFTPAYIFELEKIYNTGNFFQMAFDLFIDMLKQWDIVRKLEPRYIKVIINDRRVEIKNSDESEMNDINGNCLS